jgi:hypothetical protein
MNKYKFHPPCIYNHTTLFDDERTQRYDRTLWWLPIDLTGSNEDISPLLLHEVLDYLGTGCTLQIDRLSGIIEQIENPPTGWTYTDGSPVEPSWFYEWRLLPPSQFMLEADLREFRMLRYPPDYLKDLAPINPYNEQAKCAIPVMQLPERFKGKDWTIYS